MRKLQAKSSKKSFTQSCKVKKGAMRVNSFAPWPLTRLCVKLDAKKPANRQAGAEFTEKLAAKSY